MTGTRRTAAALAAALEPAVRLAIMNALAEAAADITDALGDSVVEVRLDGGDIGVVVSPLPDFDGERIEEAIPSEASGELSRVTLRLPEQLKTEAEQAAARQGVSLNTWLARAVREALRGETDVGRGSRTDRPSRPRLGVGLRDNPRNPKESEMNAMETHRRSHARNPSTVMGRPSSIFELARAGSKFARLTCPMCESTSPRKPATARGCSRDSKPARDAFPSGEYEPAEADAHALRETVITFSEKRRRLVVRTPRTFRRIKLAVLVEAPVGSRLTAADHRGSITASGALGSLAAARMPAISPPTESTATWTYEQARVSSDSVG